MFLSEETQPDYRTMDIRMKEAKKPCPRIDHRPLGADSYSKVSKGICGIISKALEVDRYSCY